MGCNSAKNTSAVEPSHSVSPTKKTNAEKHQTAALAALDEVIEQANNESTKRGDGLFVKSNTIDTSNNDEINRFRKHSADLTVPLRNTNQDVHKLSTQPIQSQSTNAQQTCNFKMALYSSDDEITQDNDAYETLKLMNKKAAIPRTTKYNTFDITKEEEEIPGWKQLYGTLRQSVYKPLQFAHMLGYIAEVACFVIGILIWKPETTTHSVTPISTNYIFVLVGWAIYLALGLPFMLVVVGKTPNSRMLLAEQYTVYYPAVFPVICSYFILKNYTEEFWCCVVCSVLLSAACLFLYQIYRYVKYEDDGRLNITRCEFIAVHVRISTFMACVVISMVTHIFISITHINERTFLEWDNSNWCIIVLVIIFSLGCISLGSYKDVWFCTMIAISFLGTYIEQTYLCNESDQCSSRTALTSIILMSILGFFVIYTAIARYDSVMYIRKQEEKIENVI